MNWIQFATSASGLDGSYSFQRVFKDSFTDVIE